MERKTDLKNVLQDGKNEKKEDVKKINKHKKPMQLRDIESRSSTVTKVQSKVETPENMKKFIDEEKTQLFKQPWNRLDTGMKLNRIRLFSEQKGSIILLPTPYSVVNTQLICNHSRTHHKITLTHLLSSINMIFKDSLVVV